MVTDISGVNEPVKLSGFREGRRRTHRSASDNGTKGTGRPNHGAPSM